MNNKTTKGFTLLEFIIVISIGALVSAVVGGGIVTLQANVRLDNAIRDLKLQVQTVQSSARSSFITSGNESGSQNLFDHSKRNTNLSVGWLIEFDNLNSSTVIVRRRSVFFKPSTSYSIKNFKADIDAFYNRLDNGIKRVNKIKFECNNRNFLLNGQPLTGANAFISVSGERLEIFCGDSNLAGSEYFSVTISNIQFSNAFPPDRNNVLNSCFEPNGQKAVFFATGYAKPVLNYDTSNPTDDCQLMIRHVGFNQSTQALRISKINGVVEICGAYCTR